MRRSDLWRGFWAGSAGGAAAVLALFVHRYVTGMPTLPDGVQGYHTVKVHFG